MSAPSMNRRYILYRTAANANGVYSEAYITERQFWIIRSNFAAGMPWWTCSPVHHLSRAQIAMIVNANPDHALVK